ncbi:MAG TPA: FliH/SctL family protein [Xanthobacteraceae bacterium]|nr:FliH/SctL family protein [Xanthobacteraceae bacterium]
MSAPAKFLFNADFTPFTAGAAELPISPAEHAARLAEAEANGYRKGFADAAAEAAAEGPRRNAAALERIAAAIEQLTNSLAAVEAKLEAEAVEVAVAVARKLAAELIAREPMAEIVALARDCFRHLIAAPHVVVRVNEALHDFAHDQIERIARERGFEGRLVVLAEPDIAVGDCRLEWADGGRIRHQSAIDSMIGDLVGRYLAARRLTTSTASGEQ